MFARRFLRTYPAFLHEKGYKMKQMKGATLHMMSACGQQRDKEFLQKMCAFHQLFPTKDFFSHTT
jgi:hypothetical protein